MWLAVGLYALNAYNNAQRAKKDGENSQAVANFNADQLDADAMRVRNKSVSDDRDLRQKYTQLKASQRARLAAQGVFVDSGTAEHIQDDTEMMMELDSYRLRSNAEEMARSLEDKADFNREHGEAQYQSGQDAAIGSYLAGAGQVAAAWYQHSAGY